MVFINEATWDRAVRVLVGLAMLYAGWSGLVGGNLATVLMVVGLVPIATGLIGWCPAYTVCRFSTK